MTDELQAAKDAAPAILERAFAAASNERGIHVESLFCMLGALAGYACQASVRAQAPGAPVQALFKIAQAADGSQFYFGDALNRPLAEDAYSVWSLVAGAAHQAGAKQLPDHMAIFREVAGAVGSPGFGVVKFRPGTSAGDTPANYVRAGWPVILEILRAKAPAPKDWPIALGIAAQQAIIMAKDAMPPEVSADIVMQAAIPMSKLPFPGLPA
jgi:hypothetical protein